MSLSYSVVVAIAWFPTRRCWQAGRKVAFLSRIFFWLLLASFASLPTVRYATLLTLRCITYEFILSGCAELNEVDGDF
jgi:hypothetical protein